MSFILRPPELFLMILAGWVNREQQRVIEYLRTENQILREQLGKNRILLNDDQRRQLAVKGKVLGRKILAEIGTLFTPDTILRWHRELIAKKWDYSERRAKAGRPPLSDEVVEIVLRITRENPTWAMDASRAPCRISGMQSPTSRSRTSFAGTALSSAAPQTANILGHVP
jgi:hypothetical protein